MLEELVNLGLPIGDTIVWTERTDPNNLMGEPSGYVAKASWTDTRAESCVTHDGNPGWTCGGDIEVFDSEPALIERANRLAIFAELFIGGGYYMWRTEDAIVRVGWALTPLEAADYDDALRQLFGDIVYLDELLAAIPGAFDGPSTDCLAARDELDAASAAYFDNYDTDPELQRIGEVDGPWVEALGALGLRCLTATNEIMATYLEDLALEAPQRDPDSRFAMEATVQELCSQWLFPDFPCDGPGRPSMTPRQARELGDVEERFLDAVAAEREIGSSATATILADGYAVCEQLADVATQSEIGDSVAALARLFGATARYNYSDQVIDALVASATLCSEHYELAREIYASARVVVFNGTYEVGVEIPAGTYETEGTIRDCYWERSAATGGRIIDNQFVTAASSISVTVREGEFFTTRRCGSWTGPPVETIEVAVTP